jgi:hypothetical protein
LGRGELFVSAIALVGRPLPRGRKTIFPRIMSNYLKRV